MNMTKAALEILNDEAFVDELVALDSAEEVQAKLQAKGLNMSLADVEAFAKKLSQGEGASEPSGELDEDALENVAGGKFDWDYFWDGWTYPLGRNNPRW